MDKVSHASPLPRHDTSLTRHPLELDQTFLKVEAKAAALAEGRQVSHATLLPRHRHVTDLLLAEGKQNEPKAAQGVKDTRKENRRPADSTQQGAPPLHPSPTQQGTPPPRNKAHRYKKQGAPPWYPVPGSSATLPTRR